MRNLTNASDCRRLLIALLSNPTDGPISGLDDLNHKDRRFLIVTCASRMVLETICASCGYDKAGAKDGLAKLVGDLEPMIEEICDLERAPRH